MDDETYDELVDHLPDTALRALTHMRTWNPAQLDALENPEQHFLAIDTMVANAVNAARSAAERAVPPDLTDKQREGWINMAVFNAKSQIEAELVYLSPEGVDPYEDEWDDNDEEDRERHRRWEQGIRMNDEIAAWNEVCEIEADLDERRKSILKWPQDVPLPQEYLDETKELEEVLHAMVARHDTDYPDFPKYVLGFPAPKHSSEKSADCS